MLRKRGRRSRKHPGGGIAITPTWPPDGSMILFGLDPTATPAIVDLAPANGWYVMGADGSDVAPITTTSESETRAGLGRRLSS